MAIKGIPLLDWELISRKLGATETVLRVRQAQRFISEYGFYIGLGSVWFAVALYNGIFFNKYFPITEGWFSAYAHLIRHGLP